MTSTELPSVSDNSLSVIVPRSTSLTSSAGVMDDGQLLATVAPAKGGDVSFTDLLSQAKSTDSSDAVPATPPASLASQVSDLLAPVTADTVLTDGIQPPSVDKAETSTPAGRRMMRSDGSSARQILIGQPASPATHSTRKENSARSPLLGKSPVVGNRDTSESTDAVVANSAVPVSPLDRNVRLPEPDVNLVQPPCADGKSEVMPLAVADDESSSPRKILVGTAPLPATNLTGQDGGRHLSSSGKSSAKGNLDAGKEASETAINNTASDAAPVAVPAVDMAVAALASVAVQPVRIEATGLVQGKAESQFQSSGRSVSSESGRGQKNTDVAGVPMRSAFTDKHQSVPVSAPPVNEKNQPSSVAEKTIPAGRFSVAPVVDDSAPSTSAIKLPGSMTTAPTVQTPVPASAPSVSLPSVKVAGDASVSLSEPGKFSSSPTLVGKTEKTAAKQNAVEQAMAPSGRMTKTLNFLSVDKEDVGKSSVGLGIEAAKDDATMSSRANAPTINGSQSGDFAGRSDLFTVGSVSRGEVSATSGHPIEVRESHAADAVGAIHEVVSMTDELRSKERSSVAVQFHFKDDTRLDVRVSYRDGAVQATFRTDSPELRATLNREWQVQAATAVTENRPYRLADPVFTGATSSSQPQSGSQLGGDTSRQSSQQQPQPRPDSFPGLFSSSTTGSRVAADAAVRSAPASLPETVRHLHVFA